MDTLGPVQLPLQKVIVVEDDNDIIDLLLDMKVPKMCLALTEMTSKQFPMILIAQGPQAKATCIVAVLPPERWKRYEGQRFLAFVAPNEHKLREYFIDLREKSKNVFEIDTISGIINYIDNLIEANMREFTDTTSHTYTISNGR